MPPSSWRSPKVSATTTGCRRIRTARGSSAARLREAEGDLDTALHCSTTLTGSTTATTPPTCGRCRRREPGSGCAAVSSAAPRSGPASAGSSADDELSYLREYEHVTLARLLLAEAETAHYKEESTSCTSWKPPPKRAAGSGRSSRSSCCRPSRSRPQVTRPRRCPPSARAVTLAEPQRYARVFADEGASMAALLKSLVRQEPGLGYRAGPGDDQRRREADRRSRASRAHRALQRP